MLLSLWERITRRRLWERGPVLQQQSFLSSHAPSSLPLSPLAGLPSLGISKQEVVCKHRCCSGHLAWVATGGACHQASPHMVPWVAECPAPPLAFSFPGLLPGLGPHGSCRTRSCRGTYPMRVVLEGRWWAVRHIEMWTGSQGGCMPGWICAILGITQQTLILRGHCQGKEYPLLYAFSFSSFRQWWERQAGLGSDWCLYLRHMENGQHWKDHLKKPIIAWCGFCLSSELTSPSLQKTVLDSPVILDIREEKKRKHKTVNPSHS